MLYRSLSRFSWKSLIEPWQEMDWMLILLPVALTVLGGFVIRSTELNQGFTEWWQHWIMGGIGLAIGFCVRLVFAAVELAGGVIGFQMGLNFAAYTLRA